MKKRFFFLTGILFPCLTLLSCQDGKSENPVVRQSLTSEAGLTPIVRKMDEEPVAPISSETVYICKSAGAKRYHYSLHCHGLKRCKHEVETTNVQSAEAIGLMVCKYEK